MPHLHDSIAEKAATNVAYATFQNLLRVARRNLSPRSYVQLCESLNELLVAQHESGMVTEGMVRQLEGKEPSLTDAEV